jgi:hypothetical protein
MLIDVFKYHKQLDAKELSDAVQSQLSMWRWESHCWERKSSGLMRCNWCAMEGAPNFSASATVDFPLCENNPALKEFVTKLVKGVPTLDDAVDWWANG